MVVILTQHADIAFLHHKVAQLPNVMTMSKTACQTVQTFGAKIFANNVSQYVGTVCPPFNITKTFLLSMKICDALLLHGCFSRF